MTTENQETDPSTSPSKRKETKNGFSKGSRSVVHFVLQGKGGIGKSLVSSLLAQFTREAGRPLVCLDTDPVQNTFAQIESLGVEVVDLLDGQRINVPVMDALVARILGDDADYVIDGGASSFVPLSVYLLTDSLIDLLAENKRVIVHSVIAGGRDLVDTTLALEKTLEHFPEAVEKVAWLNPHYGSLDVDGVPVEETAFFRDNAQRIAGFVRMPSLSESFSGACFRRMVEEKITFEDARSSPEWDMISRWRLANVWEPLKRQLSGVL